MHNLALTDFWQSLWQWFTTDSELSARLIVAALLGAIVGAERGARGRSAGLRTQMLVSIGSALAMIVSLHFAEVFGDAGGAIRIDPARMAYGVMGGVGFLGAGAIMRFGADIKGLTTAASLWCTAAIGLAAGFGMFTMATVAAILVFFVLGLLRTIDHRLPHPRERELTVTFTGDSVAGFHAISEKLKNSGMSATNLEINISAHKKTTRVSYLVKMKKSLSLEEFITVLDGLEFVEKINLK